jgi:hypothetical protein
MKTNLLRMCHARCAIGAWIFISTLAFRVVGQTNSWTSPTSGYWEDPHWSLGILPSTNQTIFFTNSGWKALAIGPNTSKNYSQTLTIHSLYVSSPGTDTVNTLLFNYSGLQTPLQITGGSDFDANFILGTNCYVLMLSSALAVGNVSKGDFSIGGTFNESENSFVSAVILNVGDLAPGVFNLTNSALDVLQEYIGGGGFPATFNQQGGTNSASSSLVLSNSGTYNLYDGYFSNNIEFLGGYFNQFGGNVSASFYLVSGGYNLAGGTFSLLGGNLTIPNQPPPNSATGVTSFSQSGGTNISGSISLGGWGNGEYSLSGGTLIASNLDVEDATLPELFGVSTFSQSGGYHTNGSIGIGGAYNMNFEVEASQYELSGGILATPSIGLNTGNFIQSGGTNEATVISLTGASLYSLSGGWLFAQTIQHSGGNFYGNLGSIQQSGGTNQVGTLSLSNSSDYTLGGGQLTVGEIQVAGGSIFNQWLGFSGPGSLDGVNLLTLAGAIWDEDSGGQQSLGQLQLSGDTNDDVSFLLMPFSSCTLNFANSSGLVWSNAATLSIWDWNGSLYGGGNQQIIFGNSAAALTSQQLHQIQFQYAVGLPSGTYPARILATGEIVPDAGAPLPLEITTPGLTNGAFHFTVEGNIGKSYSIEASTNLQNWVLWTTLTDLNGTISVTDWNTTNFPRRFYRAQQKP